jgi:hypothetical protein
MGGKGQVMATRTRRTRLSDEDLERLLGLVKGANSVELKLTVPEDEHRSTAVALGMDPIDAQIRQVFFFDTPDLALNKQGLVVRARRVQGRAGDSVVKLRPVVPDELPDDVRRSRSVTVEVDAMPGGYVCSATMKGRLDNAEVREAAAGKRRFRKLFTKEQRAFFAAHAPNGIALDELSLLGPILVLKLNFLPPDFGRKMVAELWLYPDSSRILELSTKCTPAEMAQVAVEARSFLTRQKVNLTAQQQTKTKAALEFFSGSA